MIFDSLANLAKYEDVIPHILLVSKFLKGKDIAKLHIGKIELDGEKVYLVVSDYKTKRAEKVERKLECHRKYADVHIADGHELIYFADKSSLRQVEKYDRDRDVEFYAGRKLNALSLSSGQFAIFLPGEPHEPGCALGKSGKVRKLVFKIRID